MEVSKACTLASLFTRVNTTQHTDLFLVSLFVCHSAFRIAPNHHAIHLLLRYGYGPGRYKTKGHSTSLEILII